jgi:DNA-binding beta-propeller fold protein YncE
MCYSMTWFTSLNMSFNNSNVYVTSYRSNKVVVLEPDGRQGRQLISSDDGLNGPTGLYFDKSKNCLLVTNFRGPTQNNDDVFDI